MPKPDTLKITYKLVQCSRKKDRQQEERKTEERKKEGGREGKEREGEVVELVVGWIRRQADRQTEAKVKEKVTRACLGVQVQPAGEVPLELQVELRLVVEVEGLASAWLSLRVTANVHRPVDQPRTHAATTVMRRRTTVTDGRGSGGGGGGGDDDDDGKRDESDTKANVDALPMHTTRCMSRSATPP
jgi:hypothetical protein